MCLKLIRRLLIPQYLSLKLPELQFGRRVYRKGQNSVSAQLLYCFSKLLLWATVRDRISSYAHFIDTIQCVLFFCSLSCREQKVPFLTRSFLASSENYDAIIFNIWFLRLCTACLLREMLDLLIICTWATCW